MTLTSHTEPQHTSHMDPHCDSCTALARGGRSVSEIGLLGAHSSENTWSIRSSLGFVCLWLLFFLLSTSDMSVPCIEVSCAYNVRVCAYITCTGSLCCSEREPLPLRDRGGLLGSQEGVSETGEVDHRQDQGAPREQGGGGGEGGTRGARGGRGSH